MQPSRTTPCANRSPLRAHIPQTIGRSLPHGPLFQVHTSFRRRGYTHHGIYVGGGRVVQYGGLVQGLRRGSVEEVSLEQFANGHALWIRYGRAARFDADEVVRRARSRIGEDRYRLLTNNCEHFCEWCLRGEHRSYQVDEWLSRLKLALRIAYWTIRKIRTPALPRG